MKPSRAPLWLLLLVFTGLVAIDSAAARRASGDPTTAREPIESRRNTVLTGRTGRATVVSSGRLTRVPLRRGERLLEIAETGQGWAVAGVRANKTSTDLFVIRDSGTGVDRLPSPARAGDLHRAAPRLLVEREGLGGIAWLEGSRPDRLAIRSAQWTGGGWTPATEVAAPAPGSQTGLAQAVLADGSWLLVWSRYDGRENEVYWSRWNGAAWTPPAPIEAADGVPDVTPTLVADGDGALVAWSEYDGQDYRLRAARLTGDGWSRLPVAAGPGVLRPRFRRSAGGTWVLARSAKPGGWLALEMTANGGTGRLARVDNATLDRPLLRIGAGAPVFEWLGTPPRAGRWELSR